MCGIAGIYSFKRTVIDHGYLKWCLNTMQHRGPDSKKIWSNNVNYSTAFARLSIRDLSEQGNQPMVSACGNYCISFNGEIYNTHYLSRLLAPFCITLKSITDTELLLYAMIHLGVEKTLSVVDGMYAFAFYSLEENKLILARDRVGIKPLYIGVCDDGVVYSSQYDHIINHSYFKNENINDAVIGSYLLLGYMPENSGVINKTLLFPHGHYAIVKDGSVQFHSFYNYSFSTEKKPGVSVDEVLCKAVRDQLISDVPVGSFMSGGVDSALVSYFTNKHSNLKTFTLGLHDNILNESEDAARFAKIFCAENHCRFFSPADLLQILDINGKAFSEPFADPSSLPTLLLSAFAKEKVTVALSGDGGDELFWGYPRNRKAIDAIGLYSQAGAKRKLKLLSKKIIRPRKTDMTRHWGNDNFIDYYATTLYIPGAAHWVPKIFEGDVGKIFFQEQCKKSELDTFDATVMMNVARKFEVDIHLQRILLKIDRASMYNSLEVRVPFLSNAMLDYSNSLAYNDCIVDGVGKYNLKTSLIQKTNEQLVLKQKRGFDVPLNKWMRSELKDEITTRVLDMPQHLSIMFKRKQLEILLNEHMSGKTDWSWFLWTVYSIVKWDAVHKNKYKPAL